MKKYWLAPLLAIAIVGIAHAVLVQPDCTPLWKSFGVMVILVCP